MSLSKVLRPGSPRLVLASTSPYRRSLLGRLGLPFEVTAPTFDEEAARDRLLGKGATPPELAQALALGKAQVAAREHPDAVVLGADQMAALGDDILGKPGTRATALEQLQLLQGKTHQLLSAMALVAPDGSVTEHLDVTSLTMRALSPAALGAYVDRDQPYDCAGSYRIEDHGIALFERIETRDATAIEGLPLLALSALLLGLGFSFPG